MPRLTFLWRSFKGLLTNPNTIFWNVIMIAVWISISFYAFRGDALSSYENIRLYHSIIYSCIYIALLFSAMITILFGTKYIFKALSRIVGYPSYGYLQLTLGLPSILLFLVLSLIYFNEVLAISFFRFGMIVLPVKPLGLILTAILSSLFVHNFSLFLYLMIKDPERHRTFTTQALPSLGVFLGIVIPLYIDIGTLSYFSPFHVIISLNYYFYSNDMPVAGDYMGYLQKRYLEGSNASTNFAYVDPYILVASLILWILLLALINYLLYFLNHGRGVSKPLA